MKSGVCQPEVILALGLRKEEAPGRQGEKTRGRGLRHRWAGKTVLGALLHAIDGQQADLSQLLVGKIGFLFGALAFLAADARFTRNLGQILFRSEEHTSELQSRSDLVCRLLLEKKKNTTALLQ